MTGRLFAWNPTVYDGFGDTLTFYLIEARTFQRQRLYDDLATLLDSEGYTSYRIYHVFGDASIILRVWVTKGSEEDLARKIETKVPQVQDVDAHVVWDIPHHWKWGPIDFRSEALGRLTPPFVTEVQSSFANPSSDVIASAINDGLLREVNNNPENILFFTFIKTFEKKGIPRNRLGLLVDAANSLFKKMSEQIDYSAVYILRSSQTRLLIKGETTRVFHIGDFVSELNDTLSLSDCVTMTSVVGWKPIVGREEIGSRSFHQIEHRDVAVAQVLPELFDAEGLEETLKTDLASWTKQYIVPRNWKKKDTDRDRLIQLREALVQIIESNEDGFSNALNAIFRAAERPLRDHQGHLIAKNIPDQRIHQILAAAIHHVSSDDAKKLRLNRLTLGDRLEVYVYVLKTCQLTNDDRLLRGWGPIVELRNDVAHNTRDLLPDWKQHITTVIDFLDRYDELLKVVQQNS